MPRFTLTQKAISDLKEIGRYTIKQWGLEQRNLYLRMLDASFQQLAENPLQGRDCSEIRKGYRRFGAGSHIIFYRITSPDDIEIVRVLHRRMDPETQLTSL